MEGGSRVNPAPAGSLGSSSTAIAPEHPARWIAPVTYVGVIAAALHGARGDRARHRAPPRGVARENATLSKPDPARYIVLGVILIVLMVLRPNGLLGERRVEIV